MTRRFTEAFDGRSNYLIQCLDVEHGLLIYLSDFDVLNDWQIADIKVFYHGIIQSIRITEPKSFISQFSA